MEGARRAVYGSGGAPATRRTRRRPPAWPPPSPAFPIHAARPACPFPWRPMPSLAVTARLAQQTPVSAMAEWGASVGTVLAQPGFPTRQTRCQSTLQRLFATLDGHAPCADFAACVAADATPPQPARALQWQPPAHLPGGGRLDRCSCVRSCASGQSQAHSSHGHDHSRRAGMGVQRVTNATGCGPRRPRKIGDQHGGWCATSTQRQCRHSRSTFSTALANRSTDPTWATWLDLYERYQADPASVDPETSAFFANWTPPVSSYSAVTAPAGAATAVDIARVLAAAAYAQAIRAHGHRAAALKPVATWRATMTACRSCTPRRMASPTRRAGAAAGQRRRRSCRARRRQRAGGHPAPAPDSIAAQSATNSTTCRTPTSRRWFPRGG